MVPCLRTGAFRREYGVSPGVVGICGTGSHTLLADFLRSLAQESG
ncbi:hypothetical protein ACIBQX_18335 [Nonomuraea sp. NPDC049714]